jgi:hypothetical protein
MCVSSVTDQHTDSVSARALSAHSLRHFSHTGLCRRPLPFVYRATADTYASGYWDPADMKLIHYNNVLPFSHTSLSANLEYLLPLHDRWWDAYGVLEPDLRID